MPLTRDQRQHQAIGQRSLERDMVDRGLIPRRGLYQQGRGALRREREIACDALEAALQRENLGGRDQIMADALRVLRGKKPRYLDKSGRGRRLLKKLRAARRALAEG